MYFWGQQLIQPVVTTGKFQYPLVDRCIFGVYRAWPEGFRSARFSILWWIDVFLGARATGSQLRWNTVSVSSGGSMYFWGNCTIVADKLRRCFSILWWIDVFLGSGQ